jgi:hypothetical protein
MKREDVQTKIPGITKEQLDWLMDENGKDVTREKSAAATLQTQLNEANAQLKTAQDTDFAVADFACVSSIKTEYK